MNEAAEVVTAAADTNANVIFGAVIDDAMKEEVRVTVIATGFGGAAPRGAAVPAREADGAADRRLRAAGGDRALRRSRTSCSTSRRSSETAR